MNAIDPANTPVLVTGASGFLGSHLAARLLESGFRVRALVLPSDDHARLTGLDLEIARGDLGDRLALREAARGQRLVFHNAARVGDWGTRREFEQANVAGTANLLEACAEAGVSRLIHTSSLAVLGTPRDGRRLDEASPYADPPAYLYTETKILAERLVLRGRPGLETTVVRPGALWGPGDPTFLPRLERLLRRGLLVVAGDGSNRVGLAHVENVVDGLVRAGTAAVAAGRIYHLTDDEHLTQRQVLSALASALGTRPPRAALPVWLLDKAASASEAVARALGARATPLLTRFEVDLLACDCVYDLSRAREELGYVPQVRFAEGIAQLARSRTSGAKTRNR